MNIQTYIHARTRYLSVRLRPCLHQTAPEIAWTLSAIEVSGESYLLYQSTRYAQLDCALFLAGDKPPSAAVFLLELLFSTKFPLTCGVPLPCHFLWHKFITFRNKFPFLGSRLVIAKTPTWVEDLKSKVPELGIQIQNPDFPTSESSDSSDSFRFFRTSTYFSNFTQWVSGTVVPPHSATHSDRLTRMISGIAWGTKTRKSFKFWKIQIFSCPYRSLTWPKPGPRQLG